MREVLKHENKPEVVVDRGFWYKLALQRLGLRYRHETFGECCRKLLFEVKGENKEILEQVP